MAVRRAAVILAGGESRRMGRPKAWLPLGDGTLLQRVVGVVAAACPRVVVVASRGRSLPPLPAGTTRVDDPDALAGGGPLVGALTGLEALVDLGADVAYVGAVDAAWLDVDHVIAMIDALEANAEVLAVVPESGPDAAGRRIVHATSGAVRLPAARDVASALVHGGQRALLRLYDGLAALRIEASSLPNPAVLRPCNTPQDYEAARLSIAGQR